MREREKRGFLDENPEKQFEKARPEMYELSRNATNVESSLYFWAAVFHPTHRRMWSGKDPSGNLVREILRTRSREPLYFNNDTFDEILFTDDLSLIRETRRQAKKDDEGHKTVAIENELPQLNDLPILTVVMMKQLILEILSVCNYTEKRLFAFILVENNINDFLALFDDKQVLVEFNNIIEELYARMREEEDKHPFQERKMRIIKQVGKREFVTQRAISNRRQYDTTVKNFREKMRPLFFPVMKESDDESVPT
jgi:PAS domain-containing protein